MERKRGTSVELADILNQHLANFLEQRSALAPEQYKALNAIKNCRTAVLGGHLDQCDSCGYQKPSYNSCRNRHCPKCGGVNTARWLASREAELLPVRYFHVVFTLPHELNHWIAYNKQTLHSLLFQSAWHTLNTLGEDKKRLGGKMAMLAVLHTWSQTLISHHHVHCIIPGGALTQTGKWKATKKYLFPIRVLRLLFRGKFVSELRQHFKHQKLKAPSPDDEQKFDTLLNKLMQKKWVVYAKEPFESPQHVLQYLGRYTHKTAITNQRLLSMSDDEIRFRYRDSKDNDQQKIMALKPHEFIRRFIQHVLPSGFMRIRAFGFLANVAKKKNLARIRQQLKIRPISTAPKKLSVKDFLLNGFGVDITCCPKCHKGNWLTIKLLPSKFGSTIWDTS